MSEASSSVPSTSLGPAPLKYAGPSAIQTRPAGTAGSASLVFLYELKRDLNLYLRDCMAQHRKVQISWEGRS